MTSDRTLGAGVYRLMAEEYRADLIKRRSLAIEGRSETAVHATDAAVLAAHLAIAEAVFSGAWPAPGRRRRRWWLPW